MKKQYVVVNRNRSDEAIVRRSDRERSRASSTVDVARDFKAFDRDR